MDTIVLKEKLQKLQGSQKAINATADYLITHDAEAGRIVRMWNEVFSLASVPNKLILLYLANDVLQRSKTDTFLPGFLHYLPKATAHLYKHGDVKIRSSVERLVKVWSERKVLKRNGIETVRSFLDKVKETAPVEKDVTREGESVQGNNKRKRGMTAIVESVEEVKEAALKRTETEESIAKLMQDRPMTALPRDELLKMKAFCEQHCTVVKCEIQRRKKAIDALKDLVSEHEEGMKTSKESLRLCFVKQEEINKAMGVAENLANLQESPERHGSLSLSEDNLTPTLLHSDETPSTMNPNSSFGYSMVQLLNPSYPNLGHNPYAAPPQGQPSYPVTFPLMTPDDHFCKTTDPELAIPYSRNSPYMNQSYMSDDQGLSLGTYGQHMMHEIQSPYSHQMSYGGYPGQYEAEKDW